MYEPIKNVLRIAEIISNLFLITLLIILIRLLIIFTKIGLVFRTTILGLFQTHFGGIF